MGWRKSESSLNNKMSYPSLLLLHRILSFLLEAKNLRFLECLRKKWVIVFDEKLICIFKTASKKKSPLWWVKSTIFCNNNLSIAAIFIYIFIPEKNLFQTFKWVMYDWNFWIKCKIIKQQVTMDPPGSNTKPIRKNQAMK